MFTQWLNVRASCSACGASFKDADPGDGPAVFVILLLGALVVGGAILLEVAATPPLWVHMVLWPPAILALALGMLRPIKGLLIAQQFATGAREAGHDDAP